MGGKTIRCQTAVEALWVVGIWEWEALILGHAGVNPAFDLGDFFFF